MKDYELIPAYFRFTEELRRGVPPDTAEIDADADAHSQLESVVREGPLEEAWGMTREVLRRAPDEELREYAVALLEQFVSWRRDDAVAPIEQEAAVNPRFKWALGCIYLDSDLSDDTLCRLRDASGGVISLPGRPDLSAPATNE